jgi:hypothetical protein
MPAAILTKFCVSAVILLRTVTSKHLYIIYRLNWHLTLAKTRFRWGEPTNSMLPGVFVDLKTPSLGTVLEGFNAPRG